MTNLVSAMVMILLSMGAAKMSGWDLAREDRTGAAMATFISIFAAASAIWFVWPFINWANI